MCGMRAVIGWILVRRYRLSSWDGGVGWELMPFIFLLFLPAGTGYDQGSLELLFFRSRIVMPSLRMRPVVQCLR